MSAAPPDEPDDVLDHLTEAICRFRPDGTLVWANEAYCRLFGVRRADVIGRRHEPRVHEDDRAEVARKVQQMTPESPHAVIENRIVDADGRVRWTQWTTAAFFDERGDVVEYLASARDVTTRVEAERELARQNERFRFLAEASRVLGGSLDYQTTLRQVARAAVPFVADACSVSLIDDDANWERIAVAHVDPEREREAAAAASVTERRRLAAGLKRLSDLLLAGESVLVSEMRDEDLEQMGLDEDTLRTAKEQQTRSYMIVPLVSRDAVLGAMIFSSSRLHSNRSYGATDLALAEELARRGAQAIENSRLVQELREQDRRKDSFLATLGHELRNPIAALQHAVEVLGMPDVDDDARTKALDAARRQVAHQSRLVDDLLDVARLTRGSVTLRLATIDARDHVRHAVEMHVPFAERKGQRLSLERLDEVFVSADPARLEQVVGNLVDNAIKYSPTGAPITVTLTRVDDAARISVCDEGPGIAPELRARVFDPFVQGEPSHDQPSAGLGIGMTIVRQLVELHHGAVEVLRGPSGKGTEVVVTLPGVEGKPTVRRPTPAGTTVPIRVLVVDDNVDAADMLASLLSAWGHEARAVYGGRDAVTAVEAFDPELVLVDIGMPDMDGYATARALRAAGSDARLVAISGYAREADVAAALEAGFDRHVAKPVGAAALQKLVSEMR